MTTIVWGPLGRAPLWQAVLHLAVVEARESSRVAAYVRTPPAGAVRTAPEPATTAARAPEIGPARTGRPPRPRTATTAHHPARAPSRPPPQETGAVRSPP